MKSLLRLSLEAGEGGAADSPREGPAGNHSAPETPEPRFLIEPAALLEELREEKPAAGGASSVPEADSSIGSEVEPIFAMVAADLRRPTVTFREAALGSLLAHAVAVIVILLSPPIRQGVARVLLNAEETPIPMTFIQDPPHPSQPNPSAPRASDRDRRRAQEESGPNPERPEPFSAGNNPAKIAEGPLAVPGPPPGESRERSQAAPVDPRPDEVDPARGEQPEESGEVDARTGTGPLMVPPAGEPAASRDDEMRRKGERLRQTLSRMGMSGTGEGGSPFRHSNPTGGLATPTGTLSFDTKGFDWGPYARRIYWIIWSNWHQRMPPAVYSGLKGRVTIHFTIHSDGRISDIQILSSSGVPAYDSAAVLALQASSPLPPLPEDFPNESDGVTGSFLYNLRDE